MSRRCWASGAASLRRDSFGVVEEEPLGEMRSVMSVAAAVGVGLEGEPCDAMLE